MKNYLFPAGAVVAVVLWAMSITPAYAADSTFNVNSYIPQKFTDFQLRLDGGFKFTGKNEKGASQSGVDNPRGEYQDSNDVREIMGAVEAVYRYETIPRYWRLSLDASGHAYHVSGNLDYPSYWLRDHGKGVYPGAEAGFYLFSDLLISFVGQAGWDYSTGSEGDGETLKYHERTYSFDIGILPGWGRMYEGQYAATSLYVVDELRKANVLIKEPDYDEMLKLTELVHHYRQTHAIDSRLHKIEALSRVMDYLREIGVVDSIGPYGCLLIQDVWDYYPVTSRHFGFRGRIGAGWQYEYFSFHQTSAIHYYEHEKKYTNRPYVIGVLEWGKPFGLHWQLDFQAVAKHFVKPFSKRIFNEINYVPNPSFAFRHEDETYSEYFADRILEISSAVRYIYNSRTSASLEAEYDLRHYHWRDKLQYNGYIPDYHIEIAGGRDHRVGSLAAILEYRVSIPTTLLVTAVYSATDWTEDRGDFNISDINTRGYIVTAELMHFLF